MKDRADRAARLQLIGRMLAGQSWQTAAAESQLPLSRATAYYCFVSFSGAIWLKSLSKRMALIEAAKKLFLAKVL